VYFFFTQWCPHCKTAKPVWQAFKDRMGSDKVNGVTLRFIEVDCEQDTATADRFNVKGYPTIKMVKDGQVFDYDAKPNVETLREFLETSLQ
jgi:protein disulfide-isomerase A1